MRFVECHETVVCRLQIEYVFDGKLFSYSLTHTHTKHTHTHTHTLSLFFSHCVGFACVCADLSTAIHVSNIVGPEHLEIHTAEPSKVAEKCSNYGAVFIGAVSAEVLGDYGVGPNHVLPTCGTSRYTGETSDKKNSGYYIHTISLYYNLYHIHYCCSCVIQ